MNAEVIAENKPRGLEPKWKVLIAVMFGIFMIILDSTIVNVAFPTLRREFGATLADAQWVLSIYVLALGVTTPVSGPIIPHPVGMYSFRTPPPETLAIPRTVPITGSGITTPVQAAV